MKQTQSSAGQHQRETTGEIGRRKPGPKPKLKPHLFFKEIVVDRHNNHVDVSTILDRLPYYELVDTDIEVTLRFNAGVGVDHSMLRKACRKALQEHLMTNDEREEREKAKRDRQEADKIGLPVQNEGTNQRTKEGAARRAKGDRRKRKG